MNTPEHLSDALTWIERNVPDGIALVARALSETYPAAGSSAPREEPRAGRCDVCHQDVALVLGFHLTRGEECRGSECAPSGHADDPGAPCDCPCEAHPEGGCSCGCDCRDEAALALAREEGRREGIEEALREVNAMKQRNAMARDRAAKAGRKNVASHRQSDVETCEQIETALRSLTSRGGGSRKDG